ncbi:MAG: COX aromatic rich motif-containing protein [Parachlamydiaceae bacterium]
MIKIPNGMKPLFYILLFAGLIVLLVLIMQPVSVYEFGDLIDILFPSGLIAIKERNLLLIIQGIMLLVIIPVYILTFVFSWKYSAQNPKGSYDPDLVDNKLAEYIWWGLPFIMTAIVCTLTWIKTVELDPYKPIESNIKPLTIQAVALQWKWLFIYPEENIASVNFLQIPKGTPIRFEITADAPMNSFWIPSLGGQIYAMPGMRTELNLIGNEVADAKGASANLSGEGFAGMHFIARTSSEEDYRQWIASAQHSTHSLGLDEYKQLAAPSQDQAVEIYRLSDPSLFNQIIDKYMHP